MKGTCSFYLREDNELQVPMQIRRALATFNYKSRLHTDNHLDDLPQYEIMSPHDWDPSKYTPDIHTYRVQREFPRSPPSVTLTSSLTPSNTRSN